MATESSSPPSMAVVFQRIVRAPPRCPVQGSWILALMEGLQENWQLPERLSMPYETRTDDANNTSTVLYVDSPLSPDASYTRLNIQLVGVLEHDLCVVIVQKAMNQIAKHAQPKFPAMMKSLFDDSERKIIKSLDTYLTKFSNGKIPIVDFIETNSEKTSATKVPTMTENQQAMMQELLAQDSIIDAEIVTDTTPYQEMQKERKQHQSVKAVLETMQQPANQTPLVSGDYAVLAAQKAMKKRLATTEFAVTAAAAVKKQRQEKATSKRETSTSNESPTTSTTKTQATTRQRSTPKPSKWTTTTNRPKVAEEPSIHLTAIRPPIFDPAITGVKRTFMKSLSRPEDYIPRKARKAVTMVNPKTTERISATNSIVNNKDKQQHRTPAVEAIVVDSTSANSVKVVSSNKDRQQHQTPPEVAAKAVDAKSTSQSVSNTTIVEEVVDVWKIPAPSVNENKRKDEAPVDLNNEKRTVKQRKLNMVTIDERDPDVKPPEILESDDPGLSSTQGALDEMIAQTKEMTPEELLRDVMNFGDMMDKEEKQGFVNGAFDTAKELLRIKSQKQAKKKLDVKELSPDEALKQMFKAGERLAEGRVARKEAQRAALSPKDDELVDLLIQSDKTISRHARVLDDDLTELEVMIQRTPGEEFDDVTKRKPIFDVMSGPEVFNPNVDPKTAVNWPGALPGTKDVRMPKELDDAVKQAKFAADVLMRIEETTGANGKKQFKLGKQTIEIDQVNNLRAVFDDAVQIGLIDNPLELLAEESRLQMLIDEMWTQPDERTRDIVSNYKDLLLSEHFVSHVRKRLEMMALRDLDALRKDDTSLEASHQRERDILGQLVSYTQLLVKEARAFGAELEASQLEVIRSICKVAMDPSLKTEEETALALTDAVRDMRPLFDDMFIAYLKYAVAEEEGRLARAGTLDDPAANEWLFVLRIVQQGVYKEIATSINRYLEHIWYILRMETPSERRMLLEELVNVMPTLDVRPFVQVVENIAGALGQSANGDFDGVTALGEMTDKILQLYRDVREVLPPERIDEKSRVADEWVARRRKMLMDQRQMTKQRLKASQETEHLDEEIEAMDRYGDDDIYD